MARLFLSYRGEDCGQDVEPLKDVLRKFQFATFLDRESIPPGDDFADRIRAALGRCDAVIALIGPAWAGLASGTRRIDQPADVLRREIALALELEVPVVPVFFGDAALPEKLPAPLLALRSKTSYSVNRRYFKRDAEYLAGGLEKLIAQRTRASPRRASGLVTQFLLISMFLSLVTVGVAMMPLVVKGFPSTFWLFPAMMALAAFLWWLYWAGMQARGEFA